MSEDVRWKQRFENFDKAFLRLDEALKVTAAYPQDRLYAIALVGAFQFTFELAWKTLKDYLQYAGVDTSLPRDVIKQAFHYQIISDGQLWIDMLADRNIMAHVYQENKALVVINNIRDKYAQGIKQVHDWLETKLEGS